MIDEEQYITTQHQLGTLAGLVLAMPLDGFVEAAERASTIGPFVDPTLYRKAGDNLANITALARALLTFKKEVLRQMGDGQKQTEPTDDDSKEREHEPTPSDSRN